MTQYYNNLTARNIPIIIIPITTSACPRERSMFIISQAHERIQLPKQITNNFFSNLTLSCVHSIQHPTSYHTLTEENDK